MSSFLEVIELPNGDVVLRRTDGDGEPLAKIQFSGEAKVFLGDSSLDVGKAMIGAGVQVLGDMYELHDINDLDLEEWEERTVH